MYILAFGRSQESGEQATGSRKFQTSHQDIIRSSKAVKVNHRFLYQPRNSILVISLNLRPGSEEPMTCLYCGKKLGFFSRYKDTPFCSEEHLRTHQEELERALMERLGSKSNAPAKSLNDLVSTEAASTRAALDLEATRRVQEAKAEVPQEDARRTEPPRQVKRAGREAEPPAPPPPAPAPPSAPAPIHEDYLFHLPAAVASLNVETPVIPAASFAIIVQADCCTPTSPELIKNFGFDLDPTEFELDTNSLLKVGTFTNPPQPNAFGEESFGDFWVKLPRDTKAALELQTDFGVSDELLPLEYEAASTSLHHTALGQRNEIDPRPRLRFPYSASQVNSTWNSLASTGLNFAITSAYDWDPILPMTASEVKIESAPAAPLQRSPSVDVPLTINALTRLSLDGADSEDFGDALSVFARSLSANAGIASDCAVGFWASSVALPSPSTELTFRSSWESSRFADRVPPVPFPSLFQLGPVLPPRPESSAG